MVATHNRVALSFRHFLAMNSMTRDCGHNCSGTATQLPGDEREVNFFHSARRELPGQVEMCEIILCHYQAAACFLIKPMNNARPFLAADAGKIFAMRQQGINQCAAFPSSARMNRNSRRFVYNNQVVVFEQNGERDLFWDQVNWLNRWFHHGNAVTRVNDVARAPRTAIYRHETLRTGGMGTVYRARDTQLDRDVALKLLRKDLGPEYANQLQQEARITASVNHPHVVQVFSFGHDHDQYYLVMELVDRGTLDDLIAEQKKLPEADALRAGIEVARGLRAAYQKGLIHRDVKPANILFNAEGMAKISDFGLAGIVEPNAQTSGAIWGTPYYVAPERLNNQPEDFRSDIYSLGATLFHAIAGRPPFEGETMAAALLSTLTNNPLKLKDVAPDVSRPTANAIARMIAPDPRLRFASHDALILALKKAERILHGEPEPWSAKVALLIAGAALIALILFGWIFFRYQGGPAKVTASASSTPAFDINREFDDGRQQIIDGKYPAARATFARLASETKNRQPIYDWALLNQALAPLLDQQEPQKRRALQEVENAGSGGFADPQLGAFLLETAKHANERRAIALSDISDHAAKPFALFLLGLTDVQLGRFNDAKALLEAFTLSQPSGSFSWIDKYKPIARKYLEDSRAWLAWREQNGSAKSPAEIRSALEKSQALRLKKRTAISAEALLAERTLANRLGQIEKAEEKQ